MLFIFSVYYLAIMFLPMIRMIGDYSNKGFMKIAVIYS